MRTVLDFLKRNAFNLVCGLVVVASIGLGVWGFLSMSDVEKELKSVSSLHSQFASIQRSPANDESIEAEHRRVETVQKNYKNLMAAAADFNRYQPLPPPDSETFFPEPTRDGQLRFRDIYLEEFEKMLERLVAGTAPTSDDIQQMQEIMDEEERAHSGFGLDSDAADSKSADSAADTLDESFKSGLISTKDALESAATKMAIIRAKTINCYVDADAFDRHAKIVRQVAFTVPDPADMWMAQVSLWIQQDVVDALARVNEAAAEEIKASNKKAAEELKASGANEAAAEELKASSKKAWVGTLPVKEVISIRVSDYIHKSIELGRPERELSGFDPAEPPMSAEVVFTHNESGDLYDLVQFTLKLVVDPRDIPKIIDEISKNRFHTLLDIEYEFDPSVLETLDMTGKIYGGEPVVVVMMDFETIFLGDIYRRMMPDAILERLGVQRPVDEVD